MAKVNVKYFGLFRELIQKDEEKISANTIEEVIKNLVDKYRIKEYFNEKTGSDPNLILTHNGRIVSSKDYGIKLKDGDEIFIMSIISGG